MYSYKRARNILKSMMLPIGDLYDLPTSELKFSDGGSYKIEAPTINTFAAAKKILLESFKFSIKVDRITETLGIFRHQKQEIIDYVSLCKDYGCQLLMSIGPRASYDLSPTVHTSAGKTVGYRLRGQEQVVYALEEILRAIDMGVNGFVIYDEGFLYMLHMLKQKSKIPKNVHLKVSAHCGQANPLSGLLLQKIGANSFNPVRDLSLPAISALRSVISIPLDLHCDNPISSGGFIRNYEVPEFIRIASPVYLKIGNSVLPKHGHFTTEDDAILMVNQIKIIKEFIEDYSENISQSSCSELYESVIKTGEYLNV